MLNLNRIVFATQFYKCNNHSKRLWFLSGEYWVSFTSSRALLCFVSVSAHNDWDTGLYRLNVDWVVHLHTFISTATFTWEALSMFVQTGQEVFVIVDAWGNYKCPFDSCGFSDTLPLCAGHCSPTLLSRSQQCFLLRVYILASEGVCFSTARLSSLFSLPILSLHRHIRLFV